MQPLPYDDDDQPNPRPTINPEMPHIPVLPASEKNKNGANGGGGCVWFLGGSVGCLFLLIALLFSLIFATGTTINNFMSGIQSVFSGYPTQGTSKQIFVPSVEPFTQLSELTTIQYNYSNIITIQTDMPPVLQSLYGNSQVLVAVGHIEAGIDMSQLTADSLIYDAEKQTLTLRLPAPVLLSCYLNDQKTYIAERTSGLFAVDVPELDTESRRFALQQFRTLATEGGILLDAQTQATEAIGDFAQALLSANDSEITIFVETLPPDNNALLPDTCQ